MTNDFLGSFDLPGMAQKVVSALIIILVTWVVATLVKKAAKALVTRIPALQRQGDDGESLGDSLGKVVGLLVWLFGLMAVLQVFSLDQVLAPINSLLVGIMGFLPNLIGAAFVLIVGIIIARIVRDILQTTLGAVRFDRMLGRARGAADSAADRAVDGEPSAAARASSGGARAAGQPAAGGVNNASIARTIATVVYAIILVFVVIVALQILGIAAISVPAQAMVAMFFAAIPNIIAAGIVLAVGVFVARFAANLLAQVLDGVGSDRALREMQVLPEGKTATPGIAKVAQVAIVLFFAVMAAQLLGFPQITSFLSEVLALGGRVLFGGAIVAVGFFLANLVGRLMGQGTGTSVVRWATIVLFVAMGLKFMGVADSIINLAFGAVVVGGALAAALAFGLGGREAAGRTLERLERRSGE